jgi:hypothetical protein
MATRLRAPRGARRGRKVFFSPAVVGNAIHKEKMERSDPPRGRPVGSGGTYHNLGYGGLKSHYFVPKNSIFMGKSLQVKSGSGNDRTGNRKFFRPGKIGTCSRSPSRERLPRHNPLPRAIDPGQRARRDKEEPPRPVLSPKPEPGHGGHVAGNDPELAQYPTGIF